MRIHAFHQVLSFYVVFCCYCHDKALSTAALMLQRQNRFPYPQEQTTTRTTGRCPSDNAALPVVAPIVHPQPWTRYNFLMISCNSVLLLLPVSFVPDASSFERTKDEKEKSTAHEFILETKLGLERIGRTHMDVGDHSLSKNSALDWIPTKSKEPLYYPTFMFGEWNVTAKLMRFTQGTKSEGMFSADTSTLNSATASMKYFQRQYFTTIANTMKNQITITLGTGIPETKVISNRAYNLPSELLLIQNITAGILPISHSKNIINLTWDYRSSTVPTRVSWDDGTNQQIRYEYETLEDASEVGFHNNVFAAAEKNRIRIFDKSVLRATIETEVTTEYHERATGFIQALSRIIIRDSRTPKSKVALDYEFSMQRTVQAFTNDHDKYVTNRPCVETPKGIVQCY